MRVDSERAFEQLMKHGRLATFRRYRYREGQVVRVYHKGKYVGRAVVEDVMYSEGLLFLRDEVLQEVVRLSGFSSLEEWINEARKLNKSESVPPYLVIIKLLKR